MRRSSRWARAVALCLGAAGCSTATRQASPPVGPTRAPAEQTRPASARPTVNPADVRFMAGMIPHHAQAVLIAGWAPSHGASSTIQRLCERIVVGQRDEIELIQNWLRDRGVPVPAADATHAGHAGHDVATHAALMPGMLTPQELARLDAARGPEYDRLLLTFMIRHHEGAITMVDQLFASPGAGQDEVVFRFASDVYADQTTEIEHMQKMLAAMSSGARTP